MFWLYSGSPAGGGGGETPVFVRATFDPKDFSGDAVGATWTVTEPLSDDEFSYKIHGKHMWIKYALWVTTVGVQAADYVTMKIPGGYTPKYYCNPGGVAFDCPNYHNGVAYLEAANPLIQLYVAYEYNGGQLPTGNVGVFVHIDFEIN